MKRALSVVLLAAAAACGGGQIVSPPNGPPDAGIIIGTELPPDTGLPSLPVMTHVAASVRGHSATITFDPVPGARDYRLYVLPTKNDIRLNSDGSFAGITNATYRCAGERAAPGVWVDGVNGPNNLPDWLATFTRVDGVDIGGFQRKEADATLGYAFADPTDGTGAVFAAGDPAASSDNFAYGIRLPQTRSKRYVTDRSTLTAPNTWRDDGIAFYAPTTAAACGDTEPVQVHTKDEMQSTGPRHLYYAAAGEVARLGAGTNAFKLCPTQVPGSLPVMRVNYRITSAAGDYGGEAGHDELVLGAERFERARCQASTFGPCANSSQTPFEVHWSNITAETVVVVEALDAPCPFQGLLAANSLASNPVSPNENNGNTSLVTERMFTVDELKAAVPHGEVFMNGHGDPLSAPRPLARAAVTLAPQTRPAMEFASDFVGRPEMFTELKNADGSDNCLLTDELRARTMDPDGCDNAHGMTSPTWDGMFFAVDKARYSAGVSQGQLWTGYSGGKWRMSPKGVTATMSDSSFLHVAMEVSSFSTARRYPQIIISQQDMYTSQWLLERTPSGTVNPNVLPALYFHPIDAGIGRHILEFEVCNNRPWQVNNHCPWFLLENGNSQSLNKLGPLTPHPDLFERLQDDRGTRFDIYVSRQRAYAFVDNQPYACVDFAHQKATHIDGSAIVPTPAVPAAGPVTVSWGDVLYHSGAESGYFQIYSPFHLKHLLYETVRHYDYVAFNSNETAPTWDEVAFPCITQMYDGGGAGTQTPEQGK